MTYDPNAFGAVPVNPMGWMGSDSAWPAQQFSVVPPTDNGFRFYETPGVKSPVMDPKMPGIGALGWTQIGLHGLNTLGNLWGALQANKLAKDQLAFTKEIGNANLNNQIKSYNTTLEDRARSRAVMEGQTQQETQAYIDANRLSR